MEFQRTDSAAGFDDLHLLLALPTGKDAVSYLQIKRTLTGARSEEAFRRPIADAARLIKGADHEETRFRIVASRSTIRPRDVDRDRDAARLSSDAADIWTRWNAPGGSSASEREFTTAVEWVIEQDVGGADRELAWKAVSRMGVTIVDADQAGSQAKPPFVKPAPSRTARSTDPMYGLGKRRKAVTPDL